MEEPTSELDLPGFRFHPTEEELLNFYLKNAISGKRLHFDIIGFLNIYLHDPSDLPGLAKIGEREWYFFVHRDRKVGNGGRPNRTTETGFWKATGTDRKIVSLSEPKKMIGLKKTLVFYKGRAPGGCKTDWVMNEYRLPNALPTSKDIVLCKIYRKATSLKVLEQRAAMEEDMQAIPRLETSPPVTPPISSFCTQNEEYLAAPTAVQGITFNFKKEDEDYLLEDTNKYEEAEEENRATKTCLQFPAEKEKLSELQVPNFQMEWNQDHLWMQLRSPWLDNLTPIANLLNS